EHVAIARGGDLAEDASVRVAVGARDEPKPPRSPEFLQRSSHPADFIPTRSTLRRPGFLLGPPRRALVRPRLANRRNLACGNARDQFPPNLGWTVCGVFRSVIAHSHSQRGNAARPRVAGATHVREAVSCLRSSTFWCAAVH